MKRLLVATDLSTRSQRALVRALSLAETIGAEVHALHVVNADLPASIAKYERTEAAKLIQRQAEAARAGRGVPLTVDAILGHPVADVLAVADARAVDLIVVGTHRTSPLKDLFVGATADQLIRLAKRPVLVVRDQLEHPYRRVLAPVDFSEHSRRAVEFAARLLPNVPLGMLHVYDMPYAGLANLSKEADPAAQEQYLRSLFADDARRFLADLGELGTQVPLRICAGQVLPVIAEEVQRQGVDLLVAGTTGRSGVARVVLGSVAADLVRRPPCDILVVP